MNALPTEAHGFADSFLADVTLLDQALFIRWFDISLHLQSNSRALLVKLADYFAPYVMTPDITHQAAPADCIHLIAIEAPVVDLSVDFYDWKREPGKSGRKDAIADFIDGRLVRKLRTGMLFLQSASHPMAIGPCEANDNQLINFINNQFANRLLHQQFLTCHAAAIDIGGKGLAMAGFSGGGKSTLMLHLLDLPETRYLTNDRLYIRGYDDGVTAVGIPKMPRVNPGTILHQPRLHGLLDQQRRAELAQLPAEELWHLEEKYDVKIEDCYGTERLCQQTQLEDFLVLNWQRDARDNLRMEKVNIAEREDLLAAVMKSPGPFYQDADGRFLGADECAPAAAYLEHLQNLNIYEVRGKVDFAALKKHCQEEFLLAADTASAP